MGFWFVGASTSIGVRRRAKGGVNCCLIWVLNRSGGRLGTAASGRIVCIGSGRKQGPGKHKRSGGEQGGGPSLRDSESG